MLQSLLGFSDCMKLSNQRITNYNIIVRTPPPPTFLNGGFTLPKISRKEGGGKIAEG